MTLDAVLFDFNGVLSSDRFYVGTFLEAHPTALEGIQRHFFESDKSLVNEWMRGHVGFREVHRRLAEHVGAEASELDRALFESVRNMRMDAGLMALARRLKDSGIKTGIVTDNMDVFTLVTVPHHGFGKLFDVIVNSADFGRLKQDDDGSLFDLALQRLDADISRTLFIDDSASNVELFRTKGGRAHQHVPNP